MCSEGSRADVEQENTTSSIKYKLAHFYTTEYDAVFVENLIMKGMLESSENARNKTEVGWRDFSTILDHHGEKNGCHVVQVDPRGTSRECALCGVETHKPLWVREHLCPTCGFEVDRDWNAALDVLNRGLAKLGVVHSEATSSEPHGDSDVRMRASLSLTPVEAATTVSTDGGDSLSIVVDASRVVEAGSPALTEATRSVAE